MKDKDTVINIFKRKKIKEKTYKRKDFKKRDEIIPEKEANGKEIVFKRTFQERELLKNGRKLERF